MGSATRNVTLIRERLDRGLTVPEAAAAIEKKSTKAVTVSEDMLRRAELGEHRPRPAAALAIAKFYGLKPSQVWPIEGDVPPESKEAA